MDVPVGILGLSIWTTLLVTMTAWLRARATPPAIAEDPCEMLQLADLSEESSLEIWALVEDSDPVVDPALPVPSPFAMSEQAYVSAWFETGTDPTLETPMPPLPRWRAPRATRALTPVTIVDRPELDDEAETALRRIPLRRFDTPALTPTFVVDVSDHCGGGALGGGAAGGGGPGGGCTGG